MSERSITTIKYSVNMQANPMKPEEPRKAYANLQLNGTVSLSKLARHIKEHGSVYGRDTIIGVLTAIVDCTKEYLAQGYAVDLGDLGVFRPGIKCEGQLPTTDKDGNIVPALQAFTSDNITGLNVKYRMSEEFQDLRAKADFEKVPSRKAQAATLAAQMAGQENADWSEQEEEEEGEGE